MYIQTTLCDYIAKFIKKVLFHPSYIWRYILTVTYRYCLN